MQQSSHRIKRASARTAKFAVAASMIAAPLAPMHSTSLAYGNGNAGKIIFCNAPPALTFGREKLKGTSKVTIVGMDAGHTIYKKPSGEYFYLEPNTGNMVSVPTSLFLTFTETYQKSGQPLVKIKFRSGSVDGKFPGEVTLVGIDDNGNVLQTNSKGEKFYLDRTTGDMKFVK